MTVDTPAAGGGDLAFPSDLDTGLEDFDIATDAVMPRLSIQHKTATFKDNLSGEEFPALEVILLGLVKQRILWEPDVDEGDKPLCKSLDFKLGLPDLGKFPWAQSGFDRSAITAEQGENVKLPCEACALKEWGTNPKGNTPWCSEQHTFPLMMRVGDTWAPALLTVQRTGIKPSKAYLTSFARSQQPLYTTTTKLSLQAQKRGTVEFAVPVFVKGDVTEQSEWPVYAQQYRSIRSFITAPRRDDDDADATATAPTGAPADTAATTPAPTPPTPDAAPATSAPAAAPDDDELPF